MLNEYAVEPRVLRCLSDVKLIASCFGIDHGRIIAEYPSKWLKMVYENLPSTIPDVEKSRIQLILEKLKPSILSRFGSDWDKTKDWTKNAYQEHSRYPFRAIITADPVSSSFCLCFDEIGSTCKEAANGEQPKDDLWTVHHSKYIQRSASEMAEVARFLLERSMKIRLIDPHFDPTVWRFMNPFKRFMEIIVNRAEFKQRAQSTVSVALRRVTVEVHTSDSCSAEYLAKGIRKLLDQIPSCEQVDVSVVTWSKASLHNRYVLTDIGGVTFGAGLDEFCDYSETSVRADVVTLLSTEVRAQLWNEYDYCGSSNPSLKNNLVFKERCEVNPTPPVTGKSPISLERKPIGKKRR